jgi:hypothetical protein
MKKERILMLHPLGATRAEVRESKTKCEALRQPPSLIETVSKATGHLELARDAIGRAQAALGTIAHPAPNN